ncbi:MAG: hypothetical protein K0S07_1274 [Chlamydiales bacterium]|jgi:hypothetical protein|nr:hypothetical protein [Chlamydiales bacterium]
MRLKQKKGLRANLIKYLAQFKKRAWTGALFSQLLLLASCQSPKALPETDIYQPTALEDSPHAEIEQHLNSLPAHIEEKLAENKETLLEHMAASRERPLLQKQKANALPFIPNYPLRLKENSLYDNQELHYTFFCPQSPESAQALVICLADDHMSWPKALQQLPVFYLQLPSRQKMSYQLLAEGDFWHCLDSFYALYPELKALPVLLATDPAYADAALLMSHQSRYRFQGLAYSGGRLGANLPNLDQLPIVHYTLSHSTPADHLFSGKRLIERLQSRGNGQARAIEGDVALAISELLQNSSEEAQGSFSFEDYRYARAWEWLKVTSKKNEEEPAFIEYHLQNGELQLKAYNVSSVEIQGGRNAFFKGIKRLRFNERVIAFSKSTPLIRIGEEDLPEHVHRKSVLPTGVSNFFSLEPLYIVYQSKGASTPYLESVLSTAELFANLAFKGFPSFPCQLPLIPLEEYDSAVLPKHRALLIGKEEAIQPIFGDHFPMEIKNRALYLNHKKILNLQPGQEQIAYGLQYPTEHDNSLQIAFALVADDERGLKILKDHYLSPANLYRQMDFCLFSQQKNGYRLALTENFDGYFGTSHIPEVLFSLPKTAFSSWELFLRKLLIDSYRTPFLAVGTLVSENRTPPSQITYGEVSRFTVKKNFARVIADTESKPILEKYCLHSLTEADIKALKDVLVKEHGSWRLKPDRCQKTFALLLEESRLLSLPTHLLAQLKLEVMPFDLQELALKAFKEDGLKAGQEILKFEQAETRR